MDPRLYYLSHLSHFVHNMNFPSKSKTVTFAQFLKPFIMFSEKPNDYIKKKVKKC